MNHSHKRDPEYQMQERTCGLEGCGPGCVVVFLFLVSAGLVLALAARLLFF